MKKTIPFLLLALIIESCVAKKEFDKLSKKNELLNSTNSDLISANDTLLLNRDLLNTELQKIESEKKNMANMTDQLNQQLTSLEKKYQNLSNFYDILSSKSSSTIDDKARENQNLMEELEKKENALFEEDAKLKKLKYALESRSKRIENLENLIAEKEFAMKNLKNAISNSLKKFENNGLTIEKKNGKVYVSMENKLLFESGKWTISEKGEVAIVELNKILVKNPTLNILIEGHTDNVPYIANDIMEDNWDLSVKRATAVVRILQKNKLHPKQMTAAGRSEYHPLLENTNDINKSKNRRIEIILSPDLDELEKSIEDSR